MSENTYTNTSWEDFKKALIFPDKMFSNSQSNNQSNFTLDIYLTMDASYFFNEESLIHSKINHKFIQAMPTLLTGLGPFFTFLKMAMAFAEVDLSVSAATSSLNGLIANIQVAALCSVFAVGYSLLFLFIEKILYNRKCALMVACLFCNELSTDVEIYNALCGLSYLGDARMAIAENPHKVENIVEGSFDKLSDMYPLDEDYILECTDDKVVISHDKLLSRLYELPERLLEFLEDMGTDFNDLDLVRINIHEYLISRNKVESKAQIMQGVKTNGIIRSIPYAFAKVKKRFSK